QKMLSLDSQGERLKQNVTGLFAGIKIDGFLEALNEVVKLFDSSTASGQALKFILETVFQPLVDAATSAIPKIIRGFLQLQIAVLKAYIAVQKLKEALPDTSGGQGGTGGMRANIDTFNAMAAAANAAHGPIDATGQAYNRMKAAMQGGANDLKATSLGGVGANMVSSLATSITAGQSTVVSAMTSTVQAAIKAAEAAAEIASPSKVMQRLGRFLPQGMAMGIDDESATVAKSAESMATDAVKGAAKGGTGKAAGGGGPNINFNNCTFGEGTDESSIRGWLSKIWHKLAQGEPEPEPG
ncbi:MAG: hypothetical protein RIF41_21080, partial [Polyangiaceae bacterium]